MATSLMFFTSCATIIRNPIGDANYAGGGPQLLQFKRAIVDDNSATVITMLKDKSFVTKDLTGDMSSSRGFYAMQAYDIMDLAVIGRNSTAGDPSQTGICRPQIVKALLDAQLPPRSVDLANAAAIPCPDVMKIILEKLPVDSVSKAESIFVKLMKEKFESNSLRPSVSIEKWDETLSMLNPNNESNAKWELASIREALDTRVYKPVRDANEKFQNIEEKHKIKFCANPNLFEVVFTSSKAIELNCIYALPPNYLKVLQVVKNGVLLTQTSFSQYTLNKNIFVKTKRQFVDGDLMPTTYVKSAGVMSFTTFVGAEKTVHAFEDLGE